MHKLVGRNALGLTDAPLVHTVSALFRAPSISASSSDALCDEASSSSDGSSDSSQLSYAVASRTRRIALAKMVLQEACAQGHTSSSVQQGANKVIMNAGALGPLLGLLQEADDVDKCCCCLDTLAFLLLDRANRRTVHELHGVDIVLQLLHRFHDPSIQSRALDTLHSLVKHDEADKARLWQHGSSGSLLDLISPKLPAPQVLELLAFARKMAFHMDGATPLQLAEPRLVTCAASLLHPLADAAVLHAALHVLLLASRCAEPAQLAVWNSAIFRLVPLLTQPVQAARSAHCGHGGRAGSSAECLLLEAALQPLLNLSDDEAFRNALFAAGCIAPMLALLGHHSSSVSVMATSVVANLSESGFSRQQLSRELPLHAILCALRTAASSEVLVGLLYILGRLASCSSQVVAVLRQYGAVQMLQQLGQVTTDEDAVLGLQQLLSMLARPPPMPHAAASAQPGFPATSLSVAGEADLLVTLVSSQQQGKLQQGAAKQGPGSVLELQVQQQLLAVQRGLPGHGRSTYLAGGALDVNMHGMSSGMCA